MAGRSQSYRTADSNEPTVSSHLLHSGNSGLRYTSQPSQRSVTPAESIIHEEWFDTLYGALVDYWQNVGQLFDGTWRAFLGGKLEAILKCLCLPCAVLTRAISGRRRYFRPQAGVMYLYIYLCVAVILNLIVALKNIEISVAEEIQKYFVIVSASVAVVGMLYLFIFVYENVQLPEPRGTLLRVFYEGGTFIFGFSSFGFSVCVLYDYISCGQVLDAIVTGVKTIFTVIQILFLHFFYEAKIPEDSPYVEVIIAQLLGTNLELWFWTVCSEEADETLRNCTHYPVELDHSEHYFSPFFVEYLLLAASLFYQVWKNLLPTDTATSSIQRHCQTCSCHIIFNNTLEIDNSPSEASHPSTSSNSTRRSRQNHSLGSGLGLFTGSCFAVLFLVLVLMSNEIGSSHQSFYTAYSAGTFVLYFSQICACYICQLSLQSHQRDPKRFSLDHEDILLYISLAGILLWEGFHVYTLILSGLNNSSNVFYLTSDALAIVQHLFQAATLVKLRRHQRTQGQCSMWICECVLFLLITNLIFWAQDSFFFEVDITTPGERYKKLQHDLKPVGYILYPLSIFFRFQSAVCCIITWSIFRTTT
mgnify:CR=1 FL=1